MHHNILDRTVVDFYDLSNRYERAHCEQFIRGWHQQFKKVPKVITREGCLECARTVTISELRADYGDMPKLRVSSMAGTHRYYPEKTPPVLRSFLQRLERHGVRAQDWPRIIDDYDLIAYTILKSYTVPEPTPEDGEKFLELPCVILRPTYSIFTAFVRLFHYRDIIQRDEQILSVPISSLVSFSYAEVAEFIEDNKKRSTVLNFLSKFQDSLRRYGLDPQEYPFLR